MVKIKNKKRKCNHYDKETKNKDVKKSKKCLQKQRKK